MVSINSSQQLPFIIQNKNLQQQISSVCGVTLPDLGLLLKTNTNQLITHLSLYKHNDFIFS